MFIEFLCQLDLSPQKFGGKQIQTGGRILIFGDGWIEGYEFGEYQCIYTNGGVICPLSSLTS